MEPIRVLIVEDSEVYREGLSALLQAQSHIEVVCAVSSGQDAIERSRQDKPDVILVTGHIPDESVTDIVRKIRAGSPEARVAVLARPDTGPNTLSVLRAGARGYLSRTISGSDLIKSLELISSGRIVISPAFASKFIEELETEPADATKSAPSKPALSPREMEIVVLIAEGATNREIAEKLFIAESTVKVHVRSILSKLEVRNRQQLAAYAVLKNWVTSTEKEATQS